ncbi:MAG: lysylphosphatidylglycerol synthase transmembrane domain-containing protein [Gemmatimonadaceae bacterium]
MQAIPAPASTPRRWLRIGVGWAVALVFITLAFRRVSFGDVISALATARAAPLLIALVAVAAGFGMRIVRWWWMLRALEPALPVRACVRPFLVSIAINNTVPLRVGDVVRAVGFRSALRSSAMAVAGTLLVERLLDVVVLLALLFAGLFALGHSVVPRPFVVAGTVVGVVAGAGLLSLIFLPSLVRRSITWLIGRAPLVPESVRARSLRLAEQLFDSLLIVRPVRRALALLALTVVAWGLEGTAYVCVAWSLGADGSAFAPWFALAAGTLATMIPSSPGYVGTFDYFAVQGLTAFGASHVVALTFALLVHLLLWLPVTVVGALFLVAPTKRPAASAERAVSAERAA